MKESLPQRTKLGLFQRIFGSSSQNEVGRQHLRDLVNLLGSTADAVGDDFFRSIVKQLTEVLGVRHCVLSKILPGSPTRLRTLAHFLDGKLCDDLEYFAEGTPAGLTLTQKGFYCPDGIQSKFPDDPTVAHLGDGCCLGLPIPGPDGVAIGHLSIFDVRPLQDPEFAEKVLRLFAGRAAAELMRGQAIEESNIALHRLEAFSREIPGWVFAYEDHSDGTRRFLFTNDHHKEILGEKTAAKVIADPQQYRLLIHPDDFQRATEHTRACRNKNGPMRLDYRVQVDGGHYRWIRIVGRFSGDSDSVKIMHGIMIDVEAEKQLTRQTEELTGHLEILIEAVPMAVILKDADGVIQFLNQRAQKLLHLENVSWLGQTVEDIFSLPGETHQTLIEASAFDEKAWQNGERVDSRILRKGKGQAFAQALDCSWIPMINETGERMGLITTLRDITDELQKEEIRQHQVEVDQRDRRMDALGRLAEGISHEFENLLTAVLGYSDICLSQIDENDQSQKLMRKSLTNIHAAASKASGLSRSLLAFSARKHWKGESCNPSKILLEFETSLGHLAGPQIQFYSDIQPSSGNASLSRECLADILIHLVSNARESAAPNSKIEVLGKVLNSETPITWKKHSLPPGGYYKIEITDKGSGIPAADLGQIFDPFFTTSHEVRGKGMGLAMVYGMVQKAGGGIQVKSEIGVGTAMQVFLPLTQTEDLGQILQEPRPFKILVVEDQLQLLELFSEILQAGNHETTLAGSCQVALEHIKNHNDFDLLVSDVFLPDGNGPDLLKLIHQEQANLPAIFFSGSPRPVLLDQGVEIPSQSPLLSKPFRPTQLLQTVAKLMQSRQ